MPIKPVEIDELESKAKNIYEAIIVAAKRARQINDEQKVEFNQRIQPLLEKEEEDEENDLSKEKMNLSIDFESRTKSSETSLKELLDKKLEFRARGNDLEIS